MRRWVLNADAWGELLKPRRETRKLSEGLFIEHETMADNGVHVCPTCKAEFKGSELER